MSKDFDLNLKVKEKGDLVKNRSTHKCTIACNVSVGCPWNTNSRCCD